MGLSRDSYRHPLQQDALNRELHGKIVEIAHARRRFGYRRRDFNEVRPHSSLGRIPPARFAEEHRQRAGDALHPTTTNEVN